MIPIPDMTLGCLKAYSSSSWNWFASALPIGSRGSASMYFLVRVYLETSVKILSFAAPDSIGIILWINFSRFGIGAIANSISVGGGLRGIFVGPYFRKKDVLTCSQFCSLFPCLPDICRVRNWGCS